MKAPETTTRASAWRRAWLVLLAAAWLAAGCGGGVDTGGTGGAATTYSDGRISGFGSIIVNGVRFDDSSATVLDDEGVIHAEHADLKLGMVVQVQAGAVSTDSNGDPVSTATQIVFGSDIAGPVQSVDATGGTLTVLGQAVKVDANTVFAGVANGLGGLGQGDFVEVYGFLDQQTGVYLASRIAKLGSLAAFRVRGPIAAGSLDTLNKKFAVGAVTLSYANLDTAQLPVLQEGAVVRVKLQTAQVGGVWIATQVRSATERRPPDQARDEVEGFITDFHSTADFKVDGVPVDASQNPVFRNGNASALSNGTRVQVDGRMSGGVLVATQIAIGNAGGNSGGHGDLQFQLHGPVTTPDANAHTFMLRGVTVHYDASTEFDQGTSADLQPGAQVDVTAALIVGTGDLQASKIRFKH
jgi:hypothetical protein